MIHIHHNSTDPAHGFHPDTPLSVAMPDVAPQPGEVVVIKQGSSGFIGTGLEVLLRDGGIDKLVVVGGRRTWAWKAPRGWREIWAL